MDQTIIDWKGRNSLLCKISTVTTICSVANIRIAASSIFSKMVYRKSSIYHRDNRRKKQKTLSVKKLFRRHQAVEAHGECRSWVIKGGCKSQSQIQALNKKFITLLWRTNNLVINMVSHIYLFFFFWFLNSIIFLSLEKYSHTLFGGMQNGSTLMQGNLLTYSTNTQQFHL